MIFWWIGNALLALVVIPLVIVIANRVVRPVLEIKAYADDILEHGVGVTHQLDAVPALLQTATLTGAARDLAGRYVSALRGEEA